MSLSSVGEPVWTLIIALSAGAVTPATLEQRLQEIAPLRADRLTTPPVITQDEYRQAAQGKVPTGMKNVPGSSFKKGYGVRVVELPIGKLWAAINDDMGKLKHTRLAYAEILGGKACEDGRRVFQFLPLPMVSDRWWVSDFKTNEAIMAKSEGRVREVRWDSIDPGFVTDGTAKEWADKGIPVNFNQGSWFLVDLDGQSTLIEYYAWSDPSGRIPAYLTNSMAQGGIKSTIDAVRVVAEEGPSCPIK